MNLQLLADKTEVNALNVVRKNIPMLLWNLMFGKSSTLLHASEVPPTVKTVRGKA